MVQEDPLVAPDGGRLLEVIAYAGRSALSAAQVLVVVGDGPVASVRGWSGSAGPDLRGCQVSGVGDLPVGTSSQLALSRTPDSFLHLLREGAGAEAFGLRVAAADGTCVVVVADRRRTALEPTSTGCCMRSSAPCRSP